MEDAGVCGNWYTAAIPNWPFDFAADFPIRRNDKDDEEISGD
jgi:hypothetical protein